MSARLRSKEERKAESAQPQFVYIEIALQKEDTLQSLCMKFGVSVADLKRVNSLLNERDIFALKTIKIPIKPNSVLAFEYQNQLKFSDGLVTRLNNGGRWEPNGGEELIRSEDDEDSESVKSETRPAESILDLNGSFKIESEFTKQLDEFSDTQRLLLSDVNSTNKNSKKQVKEAKKFFKKMDNNFETLKNQNIEILSKVQADNDQLIPVSNVSYSVETKAKSMFSANSHLNTRDMLIVACFVVVLIPLIFFIYGLYYYEK